MARSLKRNNYLVLETQAQAFPHWTPVGADFARLSDELVNLKKNNQVAVMVSNEALSAIEWFKLPDGKNYNDVVRAMYDELYKMNVEVDFIQPSYAALDEYKLIIVPALYAAVTEDLERLNEYVRSGGHVVYTFKSGFADEVVKVRTAQQPGMLSESCDITYSLFVQPNKVALKGTLLPSGKERREVQSWMELITPTSAEVLAYYDHPQWGQYAAITRNRFGRGTATYMGCLPSTEVISRLLAGAVKDAGLWHAEQELAFPIIVKSGINKAGIPIRYYFNYSATAASFPNVRRSGVDLMSGRSIASGETLELEPWGFLVIKEANKE